LSYKHKSAEKGWVIIEKIIISFSFYYFYGLACLAVRKGLMQKGRFFSRRGNPIVWHVGDKNLFV